MQWLIDSNRPLLQLRLGWLVVIVDHGMAILAVAIGSTEHHLLGLALLEMDLQCG